MCENMLRFIVYSHRTSQLQLKCHTACKVSSFENSPTFVTIASKILFSSKLPSFFTPVQRSWNGVIIAGSMFMHASVLHEMYDYVLRTNSWTCWQGTFASQFSSKSSTPYLHFQSQTFGSLEVIISQTLTDRTSIATTNTESHMWPLDWHIYDRGSFSMYCQSHAHFDC